MLSFFFQISAETLISWNHYWFVMLSHLSPKNVMTNTFAFMVAHFDQSRCQLAGGSTMASLEGLVDERDASDVIRGRMRSHCRLFLPEPRKTEPKATVACADMNHEVLRPLVMRLEQAPGELGMFAVPDLKKQTLSFGWEFFWLVQNPEKNMFSLVLSNDHCTKAWYH